MYVIRQALPSDYPHITDSFWRTYLRDSPYAKGTRPRVLVDLISGLIARPDWNVAVICFEDLTDEILGWILFKSATELGWVSVKPQYQKRGLARRLLNHAGVTRGQIACAFVTPRAVSIAHGKGLGLLFRPYLATEKHEQAA